MLTLWTLIWIAWIAFMVVADVIAWRLGPRGATFTEHFQRFIGLHGDDESWHLWPRRVFAALFWLALTSHLFIGIP